MAYVRKLPSGKFNAIVRLPNGKRKSITDTHKRVVEKLARDLESAIRRGESVHLQDRKLTVGEWAERWLTSRNVEAITARKDVSQIRTHVLPQWGDWPLTAIGRLDVQTWVKAMTHAGVGANTVTGAYHRFAAMTADAVLEGLLPASPCREIDLPRVVKPAARWLREDEYDRIQLALAVTPRAPVWQAYVALGCFSGLRPGELAGLDVEDVDLTRHLVHVHRVVTREGIRDYPKSETSDRWVPFPPQVADLLWKVIGDRGSGPVFTSPTGERVNESNFRNRVWGPALREAGVEPCRVYVMRHTCASWLAQRGVPSDEIADILGHSSTRIVATYRHMRPDAHDRVRAAWDESLRPTNDPRTSPVSALEL
jgi:integrase